MANRTTANLVRAQAKLIGAFQAGELRYRFPATYLALRAMGNIMFPNYDVLRGREDRLIETNFNLRSKRALGTGGRTHNHTGVKGHTSTLTPTWTTNDDKFNYSLKQGDDSLYNLDEQVFSEISNIIANFMEGYETLATDYLFNNRSGVNIATAKGTFNATLDAFEILEANKNQAMQISRIAYEANKYGGSFTVFCDSISYTDFQFQAAQGMQNATNLSFQFNGINFVHSVEMGALAGALETPYTKGFWIIVPDGMVTTLPWIPRQNRVGVETSVNKYSNILNPIDGEVYALHEYETRANDTSNNGYTQDVVTQIQISQDLAFAKAPLSTANETPILAFAIV